MKIMNFIMFGNKRKAIASKLNLRRIFALSVVLSLVISSFSQYTTVYADSAVSVKPDYIEEIVTVSTGAGGSTRFFMSTDNKKTWESIDITGVVDLSTLLSTKKVTIFFKGNKDITPVPLELPEELKDLTVTYKITAGVGSIILLPATGVEYKKGEFGAWKTAYNNMTTSIFEIRGATLYFRTPATAIKRAGKVVAVKIPKRPAAPSVKIDGSKLSITGLKSGETQYRIGDNQWATFTAVSSSSKSLSLNTLLNPSGTATQIPAGMIEFRSLGNDKKLSSGIRTIEIPMQPAAPETVAVTGSSISITDSNTKRAYEYTRVPKGVPFNMDTAKWTAVKVNSTVLVKDAQIGDKILVRLKSTTDTNKQLVLASAYKEFMVTVVSTK